MSEFNLNDYLPDIEAFEENGIMRKRFEIAEGLALVLYQNSEATLEYESCAIETFYYDEESERIFSNIDNVSIAEIFDIMRSKRWISAF